jgi:hypothetical protein
LSGNFFAQLKLDAFVPYKRNSSAAYCVTGGDIEILPDTSPQHAREMIRMLAHQSGPIA